MADVTIKVNIKYNGQHAPAGQSLVVPDDVAERWIKYGIAVFGATPEPETPDDPEVPPEPEAAGGEDLSLSSEKTATSRPKKQTTTSPEK